MAKTLNMTDTELLEVRKLALEMAIRTMAIGAAGPATKYAFAYEAYLTRDEPDFEEVE
jgi:hypothetical protein